MSENGKTDDAAEQGSAVHVYGHEDEPCADAEQGSAGATASDRLTGNDTTTNKPRGRGDEMTHSLAGDDGTTNKP